nr:MAG TPA: hypothetical protein [Myoviridae sp. ctNPX13]
MSYKRDRGISISLIFIYYSHVTTMHGSQFLLIHGGNKHVL